MLTAAHCVDDARRVVVTLGAHAINQNETTQQIFISKNFIIHPKWDSNLVQNDVALIKLPSPVTLNGLSRPISSAITVQNKMIFHHIPMHLLRRKRLSGLSRAL